MPKIGRRGRARPLLVSRTIDSAMGMRAARFIICFSVIHVRHTGRYELAYGHNGGGLRRAFCLWREYINSGWACAVGAGYVRHHRMVGSGACEGQRGHLLSQWPSHPVPICSFAPQKSWGRTLVRAHGERKPRSRSGRTAFSPLRAYPVKRTDSCTRCTTRLWAIRFESKGQDPSATGAAGTFAKQTFKSS